MKLSVRRKQLNNFILDDVVNMRLIVNFSISSESYFRSKFKVFSDTIIEVFLCFKLVEFQVGLSVNRNVFREEKNEISVSRVSKWRHVIFKIQIFGFSQA